MACASLLAGCLGSGPGAGAFGRCRDDQWPEWEPGDAQITVCQGRTAREAILYVPSDLEEPAPLLLLLHGGGGSAGQVRASSRMDAVADEQGFAVLYAQGTPPRRNSPLHAWNAMACCGTAYAEQVDDVRFLGALLDGALEHYPVDAQRVGVAGHSNGAMMAYRLAAERSDIVTAAMPVAGSIGGQVDEDAPVAVIPQPAHPVSVLAIHASDDDHVPFEGGHGEAAIDGPRIDLSVADAIAFWRSADGIQADPVMTERGDGVVEWDQGPGNRGTRVVLLVTEGGHGWPGSSGGLQRAPEAPDASWEIGVFLLAYPRGRA